MMPKTNLCREMAANPRGWLQLFLLAALPCVCSFLPSPEKAITAWSKRQTLHAASPNHQTQSIHERTEH